MSLWERKGYVDKLDDIVNDYNNTYHSTIKMKSVDIKSSTYIDFFVENKEKDPNFEVGNNVRISKYKINFEKMLLSKLVWRSFCYKIKLKILFHGQMLLKYDISYEILLTFYEKEMQ